jgi:hypothetical protein
MTGTNQNNYTVYTFLYDESGRGVGYTDTGWRHITDTGPPFSSMYDLPQYTQSTIFSIFWGGGDDGSGVNCYRIEYQYSDTQNLSPWEVLSDCTTQTSATFNAYEKAGSPPEGINFYTFYFRSLARDNMGTWEVKTASDTDTTVFSSDLVDFFVVDEFGNVIPDKGKTSTDRAVSITVSNKSMDLFDITINYSAHSPRSEAGVWDMVKCEDASTCVATVGPYTSDQKVDYYTYVFNTATGEVERNPPSGSYSFTMYEHPLANFVLRSVYATLGRGDLVEVRARNIQQKADSIHLRLEPDNVLFSENSQSEIDINLNPQEEKTLYAKVLFSGDMKYNITLTSSSSIDPNLLDRDTMKVTVVFAPEFPGLSPPAILLLLVLAALVYLKLVRTEN